MKAQNGEPEQNGIADRPAEQPAQMAPTPLRPNAEPRNQNFTDEHARQQRHQEQHYRDDEKARVLHHTAHSVHVH